MKQFSDLPEGMDFESEGEGGFSMDKLHELEKMLTDTLKSLGISEDDLAQQMENSKQKCPL